MKINQLFAVCGIAAALICGACTASAQDNNGGGGNGGGNGRNYGGGRRFDPAQMQKDFMDFARNYMNFTNDDEWSQIQPLVQKVADAKRDAMSGMGNGIRKMMEARRNRDDNGGGDQNGGNRRFRGGGGMFGGTPSPEYTALENAVDNNAPADQVKDLLTRYQAAVKAKQAKLKQAEDNLRQYLTPKQEAAATVIGLLD
jgi:hypothetical protein